MLRAEQLVDVLSVVDIRPRPYRDSLLPNGQQKSKGKGVAILRSSPLDQPETDYCQPLGPVHSDHVRLSANPAATAGRLNRASADGKR